MRYLPQTDEDIRKMLGTVGAGSLDDLFSIIPGDCRRKDEMGLPGPLTEWELDRHMEELAGNMAVSPEYKVFVGAGSYNHHIPEMTKQLLSRSEFYTAYTPYQPEISQGTLQAIYEYQTLVNRLLGMDVANASMYDGASSLAEALLMAVRVTHRKRVAVSRAVHPLYRRVVQTYFAPTGYEVIEIPYLENGRTDSLTLTYSRAKGSGNVNAFNFFPAMIWDATLASGIPVALLTNGTIREARGLTSRT